jgi:hypothetical protein
MADDQPVDPTPAAGMPEETSGIDSGDPKTLSMPPRWSGAAAVPDAGPRRSVWSRIRDRVAGPGRDGADDEWPTMPAVDPWADQPTQGWDEAYTTAPVVPSQAPAVPSAEMPPTRLEEPKTRPEEPDTHLEEPRTARIGDPPDRVAALNARLDAASAAADAMEKKAAVAAKAAATAAAAKAEAARAAVAKLIAEKAKARAEAEVRAKAEADAKARSTMPAPGTYPPPSGGTGLPPMAPRQAPTPVTGNDRSRKARFWSRPERPAASRPTIGPRTPIQPRRTMAPKSAPKAPPPAPAPPPWVARPLPKRKGRLRRALRRLTLFTVLTMVLCCGAPLAYTQIPAAQQFPVSAVLPDSFADLIRRETESARRAVDRLAEQLQNAGSSADAFAAVYSDGDGKRVTLYGATGFRLTPAADASAQMDRLADSLSLSEVTDFDTGEFGVHEKCGVGRSDGTPVVACTWADHGSLATVLLTRRSLDESATLVTQLRDEVLVPKF